MSKSNICKLHRFSCPQFTTCALHILISECPQAAIARFARPSVIYTLCGNGSKHGTVPTYSGLKKHMLMVEEMHWMKRYKQQSKQQSTSSRTQMWTGHLATEDWQSGVFLLLPPVGYRPQMRLGVC